MSPIISVESLSKRYLVGHQSSSTERYTALRDVIGKQVKNLGRKTWDMLRGRQIVQGDTVEEFWALKDVSFDIEPGEVVGIIGRNGAGKSTLLKVLSRITEPTCGRVKLRGRVASLLEVGTGFHPELTGRENIFLNGAILGMSRQEINSKFDEIVEFAGVEKFLDTPVKRYSSGMYVRLAFGVSAHLEPEILIVDEVLAVGDVEFQKKCLGKMKDVSKSGRTVLFVSHSLPAVSQLCTKGILMQEGIVSYNGDISHAISEYGRSLSSKRNLDMRFEGMGEAQKKAPEISISINNERVVYQIQQVSQSKQLKLTLGNINLTNDYVCGIAIFYSGIRLTTIMKRLESTSVEFDLSKLHLRAGMFQVGVGISKDPGDLEWAWNPNVFELSIVDDPSGFHPLAIGVFNSNA